MPSSITIPTIDLEREDEEILPTLERALCDIGFVMVQGHGVASELVSDDGISLGFLSYLMAGAAARMPLRACRESSMSRGGAVKRLGYWEVCAESGLSYHLNQSA